MTQFLAYLAIGFCFAEATIATNSWGGESTHYFNMIGALIILLVAAPLSLFLPKMAAVAGFVGALFMASWLSSFFTPFFDDPRNILSNVRENPDLLDGFVIFGLPFLTALYFVKKTQHENWLAVRPWKRRWARIALAVLPVLVLVTIFDMGELAGFLLRGPNG